MTRLGFVFRIKQAKLGTEAVEAFLFVAVEHQCARLIVYGRDVVDAFADGIHIHHGTAGQYDDFFFFEQLFKKFHDFRFVLGGAVVIGQAQRAHHVVLHPPELFFGRGGGTYLQLCVQLTRVGRHNTCVERFCQSQAQFRLAYAGGAYEYKESHYNG